MMQRALSSLVQRWKTENTKLSGVHLEEFHSLTLIITIQYIYSIQYFYSLKLLVLYLSVAIILLYTSTQHLS